MVEQIVVGDWVDEYYQVLLMDGQLGYQFVEYFGSECQLVVLVWMWFYWLFMDLFYFQWKVLCCFFVKGVGLFDVLCIEIDVSMEVLDVGGGIFVYCYFFKCCWIVIWFVVS